MHLHSYGLRKIEMKNILFFSPILFLMVYQGLSVAPYAQQSGGKPKTFSAQVTLNFNLRETKLNEF